MRPIATFMLITAAGWSALGASTAAPADPRWQATHDALVARLDALKTMESAFGPAYQPLYHTALDWYERWGGRNNTPVDTWMVPPEIYGNELADALEHRVNFFAENPRALFPLSFQATLPGGSKVVANYWLILPRGFGDAGRTFPLVVSLAGSGWLDHKISFVREATNPDPRFLEVTPVDQAGPWKLEFLNAYLDELIRILPVDVDRIYVQGHSLGGMATWEWALHNPERFAAISPRAGIGEPYRAIRLRNVPSWVIHGEIDPTVPTGFADEMVNALQNVGASVRYSLLKNVEHNMPVDLNETAVKDWYLRQTRSHLPVPADPRDTLGIQRAGYSDWKIVSIAGGLFWKSADLGTSEGKDASQEIRDAEKKLFDRAHAANESVDAQVIHRVELSGGSASLWLPVPVSLRRSTVYPSTVSVAPSRAIHFYSSKGMAGALARSREIAGQLNGTSNSATGIVWLTPISIWANSPDCIVDCSIELK